MENLRKSISIAIVAICSFTFAQAQEDSQPVKGNHIKDAQLSSPVKKVTPILSPDNQEVSTERKGWDGTIKGRKTNSSSDETQRNGISENGLKKRGTDNNSSITEKKGLNAVNVKKSITDSSYKDGEDGVSHTRPGNHKPGKMDDVITAEDHAINTKGTGATRDARTANSSEKKDSDVKPAKQEQDVKTNGHGKVNVQDISITK